MEGDPGWKGLPMSSSEGRSGVKFMLNAVPGVCMSAPYPPAGILAAVLMGCTLELRGWRSP